MSEPTESRPDLDPAEEFAEEAGVDPTPEQVAEYQRLEGDLPDGRADDAEVGEPDPAVS